MKYYLKTPKYSCTFPRDTFHSLLSMPGWRGVCHSLPHLSLFTNICHTVTIFVTQDKHFSLFTNISLSIFNVMIQLVYIAIYVQQQYLVSSILILPFPSPSPIPCLSFNPLHMSRMKRHTLTLIRDNGSDEWNLEQYLSFTSESQFVNLISLM